MNDQVKATAADFAAVTDFIEQRTQKHAQLIKVGKALQAIGSIENSSNEASRAAVQAKADFAAAQERNDLILEEASAKVAKSELHAKDLVERAQAEARDVVAKATADKGVEFNALVSAVAAKQTELNALNAKVAKLVDALQR